MGGCCLYIITFKINHAGNAVQNIVAITQTLFKITTHSLIHSQYCLIHNNTLNCYLMNGEFTQLLLFPGFNETIFVFL